MTDELYKKHRPDSFDQVVGQDEAVAQLKTMARDKRFPHTILFTGPSGTGKTTIARILRSKLKCSYMDFFEQNASENRGIDSIRAIQRTMPTRPMAGKAKVYLIDECFPGDAEVSALDGPVRIDKIHRGQVVMSLNGPSVVTAVMRNKVDLDRLVCVRFSDGTNQVTTSDHLFMTTGGWVEASRLNGACIFSHRRYPMGRKGGANGYNTNNSDLRVLSAGVHNHFKSASAGMLLEELRADDEAEESGEWYCDPDSMSGVRQSYICSENTQEAPKAVLQSKLRGEESQSTSGVPRQGFHSRECCQYFGVPEAVCEDEEGTGVSSGGIQKDDREQSGQSSRGRREDDRDETQEGYVAYVAGREGRQREINGTSGLVTTGIESGDVCGVGVRDRDPYEDSSRIWGRFSDELQGRYRLRASQSGGRGGRTWAQIERSYIGRCQEGEEVDVVRVVGVTSYQRGYNEELFCGCVSSEDRDRGYVEFYDLEISGHPSYFVGGRAVHNCHAMTADAQNAFLKILEDTPSHVYFFLATTDPQKLKKTIITRCHEVKCKPIPEDKLKQLVKDISAKENVELDQEVVDALVESCDNSARKALVILNGIIGIKSKEDQLRGIAEGVDVRKQAFDLVQAMMYNKKWPVISKILSSIQHEEPEGVRRLVLSYCSKVVLGGGNQAQRAADIIEVFEYNFYDSGFAGLIMSCRKVTNN